MWLQRFRFEAKDLLNIPESERVFVVFLGHISNEINILQKLIMMAHNLDDDPPPAEIQGRTAQTMCLLRVLVGKLNEAYRTIKERYLDVGLHDKIKLRLDEEARKSFEFIGYFSKPNNHINVVRKKISFHNDWEFVRQHLRSVPNNASLFIYSDGTEGNTLSR